LQSTFGGYSSISRSTRQSLTGMPYFELLIARTCSAKTHFLSCKNGIGLFESSFRLEPCRITVWGTGTGPSAHWTFVWLCSVHSSL